VHKEAKPNGALRKKLGFGLFRPKPRPPRKIAFEVYVNKVLVCTAGLDEFEFVTASLSSFVNQDRGPDERRLYFTVGGKKDKKMYKWVHFKMRKGHRVEIRIVDAKKTDEPKESGCSGGKCTV